MLGADRRPRLLLAYAADSIFPRKGPNPTAAKEQSVMTDQELQTVTSYVKDHLPDLFEHSPSVMPLDYLRLAERVVRGEESLLRLEEEIKSQNLLTIARFEAMEKRFEEIIHLMDKRFETALHQMYQRFTLWMDQTNRRFEELFRQSNNRFGWMIGLIAAAGGGLAALITVFHFLGSGN